MKPNGLLVNFHIFFIVWRSKTLFRWQIRLVFWGRETSHWRVILFNTMKSKGLLVKFHLLSMGWRSKVLFAWQIRLVFGGKETSQWRITVNLEAVTRALSEASVRAIRTTLVFITANYTGDFRRWAFCCFLVSSSTCWHNWFVNLGKRNGNQRAEKGWCREVLKNSLRYATITLLRLLSYVLVPGSISSMNLFYLSPISQEE